jgi:hypothetical protein
MVVRDPRERRSLRYIRLAAWFASRPPEVDRVELTLADIEELIGETLPPVARFPSWWRNDDRRTHSRAWLTAGWEVSDMRSSSSTVVFRRRQVPLPE